MNDIFFSSKFINFYKQNIIENDFFLYPFSVLEYNGIKSIASIGYQGIYAKKKFNKKNLYDFRCNVKNFCRKNNIIAEFIRFNPYIENLDLFEKYLSLNNVISFYSIKIPSNIEEYHTQRPIRYKQALKKSTGLILKINEKIERSIINETLNFNNEYFNSSKMILELIKNDSAVLFQAFHNNKEESASLFLKNKKSSYYIANYSTLEGKKYSANLFLIDGFIDYCICRKIKYFGLGGGLKDNDSLSLFKKQFSTDILLIKHFKMIWNEKEYKEIDTGENYFPSYLKDRDKISLIKPLKQ